MRTISDKLVERYRYINVEHDWWDCEYDYWTRRLERMGLTDIEINFSGFYSQGDGASFTANINSYNMRKFMRIHGLRDRYRGIYEMAKISHVWGSCTRYSSSYCHQNTVTYESDMENNYWTDSEELRDIMLSELWYQADRDIRDFDEEVQEILRGYMQDIYRSLEKVYHDQTSDECVRETLEANEIYDEDEYLEAA